MPRANADGSTVSTVRFSIRPSSSPRRTSRNPSTSIASVRQSSIVCRTMGWSIGTSIGPPGRVSGHAMACGNAKARRSVARIRRRGAGTRLPPRERSRKRALRIPAPPRFEQGRGEDRLDEDVAGGRRIQVIEDVFQLEAVLRTKGKDDRFLVRRGLQLEPEADAE